MFRRPLESGLARGIIHGIGPALIGAALGGASSLLGGGGGGSSSSGTSKTNQTQTTLPSFLLPFLTGEGGVLPAAQDLFESGPNQFFQGDQVADLDPSQIGAISDIQNIAANDTLNPAASDFANRTLAGDFLGGGEFQKAFGNDILDTVNSQFGRAGRTGSGFNTGVATKELGNVASRLFDSERNRQNQVLAGIPALSQSQFAGANNALDASSILQNQAQNEINADINKFNFEQGAEQESLQDFANLVFGAPAGAGGSTINTVGNTKTTGNTSGPSTNPLISAIGGAASGAGLAGKIFG